MIILPRRQSSKFVTPPPGAFIANAKAFSKPLLNAWLMAEGGGGKSYDGLKRGRDITWTNGLWGPGPFPGDIAPRFNGTSSYGTVAVDFSSTNILSCSVWFWWDAFANDDDLMMELTTSINATTNGFYVDPNASDGTFDINMRGAAGYNAGTLGERGLVALRGAQSIDHIADGDLLVFDTDVVGSDAHGCEVVVGQQGEGNTLVVVNEHAGAVVLCWQGIGPQGWRRERTIGIERSKDRDGRPFALVL
jgi:hypothetical protein